MIGIPEGKARESRAEEIAEELSKIRDRHQDPLQRIPSRIKDKKSIPRHIIFKLQKNQRQKLNLKGARGGEKTTSPTEEQRRITTDLHQMPYKQEESQVK